MENTSAERQLLERFYYLGWNKNNENIIRETVHEKVRFASNVAKKQVGVVGVLNHMRKMHQALGKHTKEIEHAVIENNKCAVRIKCTGIHRNEFFGVPGTGHEITWYNAAWFTIRENKIVEIWVLGDVDTLKGQLGAEQDATPF